MSRLAITYALALFAAPPAAGQERNAPPASTLQPDIVVVGGSLKDFRAALARCLEQRCPPDKDIAATLAVAETQFIAGD